MLIAQGLKALDDPQKGHVPTREGLRDYLAHLTWQEAVDGASGSLFFSSSGDVSQGYVDKFLAERAGELARELQITLVAAGHYATEV